jgi:hypothetical protein
LPDTTLDKASNSKLGGGSSAFRSTHAVRERRNDADRRLPRLRSDVTRCEIFIARPGASMGVAADANVQAPIWCRAPLQIALDARHY